MATIIRQGSPVKHKRHGWTGTVLRLLNKTKHLKNRYAIVAWDDGTIMATLYNDLIRRETA